METLSHNPYPLSGELSAAESAQLAGIAEASLTPDQLGPIHTEAPTIWEDFRGKEVTVLNDSANMPRTKEFGRISGEFSEAELSVAALQREARIKAEIEAQAISQAQRVMNTPNYDITRNTLLEDSLTGEKSTDTDKVAAVTDISAFKKKRQQATLVNTAKAA